MKKTTLPFLLLIAMLSFSSLTYAQFSKGQLMLDGSISFSNTNAQSSDSLVNFNSASGTNKTSNFSFSPSIAKFTSENVMYGIRLNYFLSTQTETNTSISTAETEKLTQQQIGVTFYTRRYIPLGKNFYAFVNAGITPSYVSVKITSSDSLSSQPTGNGFTAAVSLTAGVAYKLTKRFLVNVSLPALANINYQHQKETSNNAGYFENQTNSSFTISSGLSTSTLGDISIGASFLLH